MFILCLGGGIAALDAQALFYLGPFVMRDLRISNSGIGILSAAVLLTWAISGFTTSVLSDRGGARKQFIVASYLLFGVLSFISGLASSLWTLLLARLLMGAAEGPIVPLTHAVMIAESSARRRGFNMGMVQSVGAQLVGSTVSPLLLVWLATAYSWRKAFFLAGLPGIGLAVLVMAFVREPPVEERVAVAQQPRLPARIKELLRSPNIRVCLVMSCFLNAWYFGFLTFMPLYLVKSLQLLPREMSQVMASAGIGAVLGAALVPLLSDRFGRTPIMTLFALLGAVGPLGALIPGVNLGQLMAFAFIGAWAQGVLPLCIGTVPMESITNRSATASGLIMGSGMIVGGLIGPAVCGRLADLIGLGVPLWCCGVAALAGAVTSRGLTETAPNLRRLALSQGG
jgi:MFS family permease